MTAEDRLVEKLNEVLANLETGPLSNLCATDADVNEDRHLVTDLDPLGASIDSPQLVREFAGVETLGDIADFIRFWKSTGMTEEAIRYALGRVFEEGDER